MILLCYCYAIVYDGALSAAGGKPCLHMIISTRFDCIPVVRRAELLLRGSTWGRPGPRTRKGRLRACAARPYRRGECVYALAYIYTALALHP